MDELLLYIKSNPAHEKIVMDKIFLISDDPENHLLIEKKLVSNLDENKFKIHKLLAGYYFKTEKYKDALNIHRTMGLENNSDFKRWLNLAENLRKESQYGLSIDSYQELLNIELGVQLFFFFFFFFLRPLSIFSSSCDTFSLIRTISWERLKVRESVHPPRAMRIARSAVMILSFIIGNFRIHQCHQR